MDGTQLKEQAVDVGTRVEVAEYVYGLARMLDEFRLQQFIDQFTDDGRYILIPRENHVNQWPVSIIDDDRDRLIYRKNLIERHWHYEPFRANRLVSNCIVTRGEKDTLKAVSNFAVFYTNAEGATRLHMTGVFNDDLSVIDGALRMKKRYAILDTFLPDEAVVLPA